ncbi:WD repeat domain-containing protein 83 [Linum perenne]
MSVSDLPTKEANVLKGHEGAVLAARFNADGNYCLSLRQGPHDPSLEPPPRHSHQDLQGQFKVGFVRRRSRQVFYWDVSTGRVIRKFRGHDSEVNAVKFNEYASVAVSAGIDQSVRTWDCRSHSTEPIQVSSLTFLSLDLILCSCEGPANSEMWVFMWQIIDTFTDSVMSVCLTKTEILARV